MKKSLLILSILLISAITFKVTAQTLPAGFVKTTMVTGLNYPVAFDFAPDGRYFITQKGGNSAGSCANGKILVYSPAGALIGTFYDLTDSVNCDFERGLLGICLDPNFATNHYVYVYYVHIWGAANALRVLRFTEVSNVGTMPTILLNIDLNPYTVAGNHVGGNLHFRPSDPNRLYVSIGDLAWHQGDSVLNYANKLNKPFGKNLRINSDGTIPTSNPYYDDGNPATGNDDRIWSWGHRNPFDFCFSPISDTMYTSENGWNAYDEVNVIVKGKNYGWAACEGNFIVTTSGATTTPCANANYVNPITTWSAPLGGLTGIVYYSGSVIPALDNHLLVADNDYGRVYDVTLGNAPSYNTATSNVLWADLTATGGLTTLKEGSDGCIYAMKGGYTTNGQIYRICPIGLGAGSTEAVENLIGQNYPNPTSGMSQIDYTVSQTSSVLIELYDVTGRKVKTILDAIGISAGKHTVEITDLEKYAQGSYFFKMDVKQAGKVVFSETKKMMIAK